MRFHCCSPSDRNVGHVDFTWCGRLIRLFSVLIGLLATSASFAQEPDWKLVWSDEFNGEFLDYSKWEIEVNAFGGGNHELQLYTDLPKNVRVEGGHLVLEAHKERADIAGTVRDYSSGRIRSKRRGDWTYGKFEMRAKLPSGQGVWPAFWMMPTDHVYGTWASSGEIDIMEFKGQEPGVIWGTLHHGSPWPNNKHTGTQYRPAGVDYTKDFHTYALEWEKGKMTWLVDGHAYQTQTEWSSSGAPYPAPFDQKFHLILNLAIGGGFVGNVDASTPFPRDYLVDYVRVYQKDAGK